VRELLRAGAEEFDKVDIISAAGAGYADIIQMLLDVGIETNLDRALEAAARAGRTETVRILIHAGAGVKEGVALTLAAESGYKEIVRLLVDAGADVKDTFALQAAARNGHLEIVQMLTGAGADGNIIQKAEKTVDTDVIATAVNVKDVDDARLEAATVTLPQTRMSESDLDSLESDRPKKRQRLE
jgi:ankyrin repeat protein